MPEISFIISTYRPTDFNRLEANLHATVDTTYEIIRIDNPGRYSLTEAYNIGAKQAQGTFLCFVHEDVIFCDPHWDAAVLERFTLRPDLGLLGVAGSTLRPDLPIGFALGDPQLDRVTIRGIDETTYSITENRCPYPIEECAVRVLDGVLLFTRQEIWQRFPFDQNILGFHFYDIDFSFRIAQHYRVEVAPMLMLEHKSTKFTAPPKGCRADFNASWVSAALHYAPRHDDLKFDRLGSEASVRVKRFWLSFICLSGCPFILRWQYSGRLQLPLSQSFFGAPIFFPGVFNYLKRQCHKRRRQQQQKSKNASEQSRLQ